MRVFYAAYYEFNDESSKFRMADQVRRKIVKNYPIWMQFGISGFLELLITNLPSYSWNLRWRIQCGWEKWKLSNADQNWYVEIRLFAADLWKSNDESVISEHKGSHESRFIQIG